MDPACISVESMRALISELVPEGTTRNALNGRLDQVLGALANRPWRAQDYAMYMIDHLLVKYRSGSMIGGFSEETQDRLEALIEGILCLVGLPPEFSVGALDEDGAATVIVPSTTTTTTVTTGTQWAGLQIPPGTLPGLALVTITRLPDFPAPLMTEFDQYPLYYEFHVSAGFTGDVIIGTCLANGYTPPDESRLRIAHNISAGGIEILDLVPTPFLECSDAGEVATHGIWGFDLARGGVLLDMIKGIVLPRPLEAATRRAGAGVGGTVRTFSPFGIVDTLAFLEEIPSGPISAPFGQLVNPEPAVRLVTPTGNPMEGMTVKFLVNAGGGTVAGTNGTHTVLTDANGIAMSGGWRLGFEEFNQMLVKATAPARTGFTNNNPGVFQATGTGAP